MSVDPLAHLWANSTQEPLSFTQAIQALNWKHLTLGIILSAIIFIYRAVVIHYGELKNK